MRDPGKTIKAAVKDAQQILAQYIQPGERDCGATINKLLTALDNDDLAQAIIDSDEEDSNRDRRSEDPRPTGPQPH